jgi:hypothetical protein
MVANDGCQWLSTVAASFIRTIFKLAGPKNGFFSYHSTEISVFG